MGDYEEVIGGKVTELIKTCRDGNVDRLKVILEDYRCREKPLHECDIRGWQAIHESVAVCSDNHLTCMKMLLTEEQDLVYSRTRENFTPLMISCGVGNIRAVTHLLELLDEDDLDHCSIHGDNALIHAIRCQGPEAENIAALLTRKNHRQSFLHPSMSLTKPIHEACEHKRTKTLVELLQYNIPTTAAPDHVSPPIHICIESDWPEGMKILIKEQKLRNDRLAGNSLGTLRPDDSSDFQLPQFSVSIDDFLTMEDCSGLSPMSKACSVGNVECIKVLLDEGISPLITSDSMYNVFPLSYALNPFNRSILELLLSRMDPYDIEKKCQEYFYEQKILVHPLTVMDFTGEGAIENFEFLLKCGFPLNLWYIPYDVEEAFADGFVSAQSTMSYIMFKCSRHINGNNYHQVLRIASLFLEANVPITAEALVQSCRKGKFNTHTLILKFLSKKPLDEIKNVLDKIVIRTTEVSAVKDVAGPNSTHLTVTIPPLLSFQLIMKGFLANNEKERRPLMWNDAAVLFFTDKEKQSCLSKYPQIADHPLICDHMQLPSSLRAQCRSVIRKALGWRLLKEPVPHSWSDVRSDFPCDETWEESIIDQMKIPSSLKDYLRYKDVFEAYVKIIVESEKKC